MHSGRFVAAITAELWARHRHLVNHDDFIQTLNSELAHYHMTVQVVFGVIVVTEKPDAPPRV
jgi:hypothetical protein